MPTGNPSSWVNLQDYLSLNSDQGQQMATDVYNKVSGTAQKAGQQLTQDTQGFNNAVQAGTVQAPNTDYSQVDPNQASKNAAKGYSGPSDLASYDSSLEGNVANAVQQMQQAGDPNQRGQVLQETYGAKAGQSVGDSAFDNFLTSAAPGASKLNAFGQQYQDLQNTLGLNEQNAYDAAQGAQGKSQQNAQTWANDAAFQQGMKTVDDIKNKNHAGYQAYAQQMPGTGADLVKALTGQKTSDRRFQGLNQQALDSFSKTWMPNVTAAGQQLGLSNDQLMKDLGRMSGKEATDFMVLGVVPPWMSDVDASKRGRVGGWESPQMGRVLQYGSDGGMWNAVTNTWKNSVQQLGQSAAGGPSGIMGGAVKTAAGGGSGKGISY